MTLRIIEQNVKKWQGRKQFELLEALVALGGDVICLTEHRATAQELKIRAALADAGYTHQHLSLSPDNAKVGGIMIASRTPYHVQAPSPWQVP